MWGQKIFRIFSFIEYSRVSIFWGGWRSGHQLFLGHVKFEVKKFLEFLPLQSTLDSEFLGEGSVYQLFWSCQIWGKKFFRIFSFTKCCGLSIFLGLGGFCAPTFFGHIKFEIKMFWKFFPLLCALDSEFVGGCPGTNFFWSCQIWGPNIFRIFSVTEHSQLNFLEGGVQIPNFFGHSKFETKNFSEFFS